MNAKSPGQANPVMLDGEGLRISVIVSRFNHDVTYEMRDLCVKRLRELGVSSHNITVVEVPGSVELPIGAMHQLTANRSHAAIAIGAVVRGVTDHYEFVARAAADGLQQVAIKCGKPVIFGVLTTDNMSQAKARIDQASTYAENAVEMANVMRNVLRSQQ